MSALWGLAMSRRHKSQRHIMRSMQIKNMKQPMLILCAFIFSSNYLCIAAEVSRSGTARVRNGKLATMLPTYIKPHTEQARKGGMEKPHLLPKYHDKIIFVGQLPFNATHAQVDGFFKRKGLDDLKVRMLTDKTPEKKFRGIAFVEFSRASDASKALKLDHHLFGNRRIRIERTAVGGGNNQKRKGRLQRSKQQQELARRQEMEGILDRIFARRDAKALKTAPSESAALHDDASLHPSRRQPAQRPERTPVTRDISKLMARRDCDELLVNYLCSLPDRIASKAARACSRLEVSTVDNRGAFAMGMIKRKLRKAEKKAKKSLVHSQSLFHSHKASMDTPSTQETHDTARLAADPNESRFDDPTLLCPRLDPSGPVTGPSFSESSE